MCVVEHEVLESKNCKGFVVRLKGKRKVGGKRAKNGTVVSMG